MIYIEQVSKPQGAHNWLAFQNIYKWYMICSLLQYLFIVVTWWLIIPSNVWNKFMIKHRWAHFHLSTFTTMSKTAARKESKQLLFNSVQFSLVLFIKYKITVASMHNCCELLYCRNDQKEVFIKQKNLKKLKILAYRLI